MSKVIDKDNLGIGSTEHVGGMQEDGGAAAGGSMTQPMEITDRCEMFDMQGRVPAVYPPGHVFIVATQEPEFSVLSYVTDQITVQEPPYYCLYGHYADQWEKKIRAFLQGGEEATILGCGEDRQTMVKELVDKYTGKWQPRCYVMYDDRDEAMAVRDDVLEGIRAYRTSICETLRRLGTLEFFYAGKDFVVSVDEDDVMLGRLGQEERADSLEDALDLPVFSDWTLFRLWCRIQGAVRHRIKEMER